MSGPDAAGQATATIDYTFPTWLSAGNRALSLYLNGAQVAFTNPATSSGTWVRNVSLACARTGAQNFITFATSCQKWGQGGYSASAAQAVPASTKPDVNLTLSPPDANGAVVATYSYSFPNTNSSAQRAVSLWVDGQQVFYAEPGGQTGTFTKTLQTRCWTTGAHQIDAAATSCKKWNDDDYQDKDTQTIAIDGPAIDITPRRGELDPAANTRKIEVTVAYSLGANASNGTLVVDLASWREADGTLTTGSNLITKAITTSSGTETVQFTPPTGAQQVHITGYITTGETPASCGRTATDDAWTECTHCADASANPVYYTDGNMRLDDSEALPPVAGMTQSRVYNSDEQIVGLFGRGWTTLFDRRLYVDGPAVSLSLDTNEAVTFRNNGGTFVQVWPTARRDAGSLKLDAATSTYVYRAAGSQQAVVFRASDGRLMAYRDLRSGREAQIGYDAQGLPQSLTDSWTGVSWVLTLNTAQRTVARIAVAGRPDLVWTYSYDANGNLTAVLAPGNAPWRTYEYAEDRMTASYDALGNLIESHTYDADGFATSSTGDIDEISSIVYNIATANPGERLTRVTHRSGAVVDHVLAPSGSAYRSIRVIGGCAACGSRDTTSVRDAQGRVIRMQRADGYVDITTYSGTHVVEEQRHLKPAGCDPETSLTHCRLESAALATATLEATAATISTNYAYGDANWPERPTEVSVPSVLQSGQSRRETFVYDAATGTVTTHTIAGWSGSPAQSESHTTATALYNGTEGAAFAPGGAFAAAWVALTQPAGGRKTSDGPRTDVQDVSSFVYYPVHADVPALLRGHLAATKNASGHIARFEDYDVFGNAARIIDANGVNTALTFDALGRVLTTTVKAISGCNTTTDPLCATDLTSTKTYASTSGPRQSDQRPGGGVTTYTYDSRGRVRTISRGPSATDLRESIEYSYDTGTGRKSLERMLAREGAAWVETKREAFAYDIHGGLQTITHADATTVSYTYDVEGRLATVRDETHQAANTSNSYDPAGRLTVVEQTLANAPGGSIETRYAYDLHGNLTSVTDPNENVTTYAYDDFGRMLTQTSPVTGTTVYSYDLAGNLTSVIDANAAMTTRTYDAAGRVLTAVSTRSGRPSESITWTYDGGAFGLGRLTTMSDGAGTTAYTYDRRGLLLSEARTFTGVAPSTVTSFGYDADGNRSKIGYPSGAQALYTFDFAGRPLSVSFGGSSVVTSATYRPFGPLISIAFGNGTAQTMEYDQRYRITMNRLSAPIGVLVQYSYGYDDAGNVTAIDDDVDATYSRSFGYDDLSRLVTANSGTSLWRSGGYTYDAMGNMQSLELGDRETVPIRRQLYFTYEGTTPKIATVRTNNIVDPGEPLLRIGTQEYGGYRTMTYDAAGNETNYAAARTYSARNLLSRVEEPSETADWQHRVDYGYDDRGIRVWRTETGVTTTTRYYTYLPELRLLSMTDDDGATVRDEFVWFGDRPVAQISPERSTTPDPELSRFRPTTHTTPRVRYTTFADQLGTPILQTDPAAAITWRAEYEPYGDIWLMRTGRPSDQPLRFPGQEAAMTWEGGEESYNVFRWCRGGWGRYTQVDRAGILASPNLYSYVAGNPLRWTDPKGLYRVEPPDGPRSEEINRAIFDLYRRINARRPCCDQDTASRLMGFLSSPNLIFEYDATLPICATVSDETMNGTEERIIVGAAMWTPACKCSLASVILHEMAHAAFMDRGESGPDAIQLQCYGCQQPRGGQ